MAFATFERMPRRLGWQQEYYDGKAHIEPYRVFVPLVLDLRPRKVSRRAGMRSLLPADAPELDSAFLDAFAGAPEYATYPARRFRNTGSDYLERFFGNDEGAWSPASLVAAVGRRIVAAAFIKQRPSGPLLDCLLVRAEHQRHGWGTALVARAVTDLCQRGERELHSYALLGNQPSLAWHLRFGFRELADLRVAWRRFWFFRDELDRCRRFGHSQVAEQQVLEEQLAHWAKEAQRLELLAREDWSQAYPRFD